MSEKAVVEKKEESTFLSRIMKSMDWQLIAYQAFKAARPGLLKKVKATESKWDDRALEGVDYLVEKFLKPEKS